MVRCLINDSKSTTPYLVFDLKVAVCDAVFAFQSFFNVECNLFMERDILSGRSLPQIHGSIVASGGCHVLIVHSHIHIYTWSNCWFASSVNEENNRHNEYDQKKGNSSSYSSDESGTSFLGTLLVSIDVCTLVEG